MKLKFKLNLQQFGGQGFMGFTPTSMTVNNQIYNTSLRGTNANENLSGDEIKSLIQQIQQKGRPLTREEIIQFIQVDPGNVDKQDNILRGQQQLINNNTELFGFNSESSRALGLDPAIGEDGKVSALNQYYEDLYSLEPGTGGAEMLSRLEQGAMNQAQQGATLADVNFQQAAMQQAQTVKAITDQVRSERMSRLRAGMSESQIANQDMQMLMTNVNTLNQNSQMLNQQRLEAQMGMNLAQDQAYQDYLAQSAQRGQVASAMAASDAGDAYQQTIRQMSTLYGNDPTKWTATQWSSISNQVTGQNQPK
jgi:hypothetical protein